MKKKAMIVLGMVSLLGVSAAWMQQQDLMKERLRVQLKDHELQGKWIYDDIEKGFAEAKRTDKPLLVVFRCVP